MNKYYCRSICNSIQQFHTYMIILFVFIQMIIQLIIMLFNIEHVKSPQATVYY